LLRVQAIGLSPLEGNRYNAIPLTVCLNLECLKNARSKEKRLLPRFFGAIFVPKKLHGKLEEAKKMLGKDGHHIRWILEHEQE
jgi:hypothetical protein